MPGKAACKVWRPASPPGAVATTLQRASLARSTSASLRSVKVRCVTSSGVPFSALASRMSPSRSAQRAPLPCSLASVRMPSCESARASTNTAAGILPAASASRSAGTPTTRGPEFHRPVFSKPRRTRSAMAWGSSLMISTGSPSRRTASSASAERKSTSAGSGRSPTP
jgi:hypothetical protein